MKIYQFNCYEGNDIDLRQADAVLKYKPDIIIREAPSSENRASLAFDPRKSVKKLEDNLKRLAVHLQEVAKKDPWVLSDIKMFENAIEVLKTGHKIRIYDVDAPCELLKESRINKWSLLKNKPERRGVNLIWWVYIYLRERTMSKNIAPLFKNKDQSVLVFIQKFHWLNIKFLLSNPKEKEIWNYYFGRFKDLTPAKITSILKRENPILYQYWKKYSL